MSAAPVSLNQGPPLPPGVSPPQPTMQGLAGGQQAPDTGSASLQQQVIQKLMFIESTMQDVATILPASSGIFGDLINQMRQRMGQLLMKGASPQPTPGPTGTGLMMSPAGGAGAAPTS